MFHEAALPTMFNLIDHAYREQEKAAQVLKLADCWGHCCTSDPSREDILFHRCGHRLNYLHSNTTAVHYDKLDQQMSRLGTHTRERRDILETDIPLSWPLVQT